MMEWLEELIDPAAFECKAVNEALQLFFVDV